MKKLKKLVAAAFASLVALKEAEIQAKCLRYK